MPIGPNGPPYSLLDQQQILQRSFEESSDRLRVDAQVSAVISATDTTIKDFSTSNHLVVNPDGSIDVNAILSASTDNIAIADAISGNKLIVNADGSINISGTVTSSGTSTVTGTVSTNINGLAAFQTSQYAVSTSAVQLVPTPMSTRSSMSVKVITAVCAPHRLSIRLSQQCIFSALRPSRRQQRHNPLPLWRPGSQSQSPCGPCRPSP